MTPLEGYRLLIWILDLEDGGGSKDWRQASPSITKGAGAAAVVVGLRAAWVAGKDVHGAIIALVTIGITALFGRSMWKCWLMRNTWSNSTSANASYTREERSVKEERTTELRFVDGVPAVSLPPNPAARTPAGDE